MPYLAPPPDPAPVVVVRDIGGDYSVYRKQTDHFLRHNREVQLHECRSACTLALSLPKVCVFRSSILRFAKIYDRDTRRVDVAASDELFSSYPQAVRERLGYLTRRYKALSGEQLIALGIRDCNTGNHGGSPGASAARTAIRQPVYVPPGHGPVARFLSRMKSGLTSRLSGVVPSASTITGLPASIASKVAHGFSALLPRSEDPGGEIQNASRRVQRIAHGPLAGLGGQPGAVETSTPGLVSDGAGGHIIPVRLGRAPLPPRRPSTTLTARYTRLPKLITGAHVVLPPRFSAYAPLR